MTPLLAYLSLRRGAVMRQTIITAECRICGHTVLERCDITILCDRGLTEGTILWRCPGCAGWRSRPVDASMISTFAAVGVSVTVVESAAPPPDLSPDDRLDLWCCEHDPARVAEMVGA